MIEEEEMVKISSIAVDEMEKNDQPTVLPWYWPGISRKEAFAKLKGLPDGSFLIRDSTTPGEFTLMVRQKENDFCLKILNQNGKLGLTVSEARFSCLEDLVNFYSTHSLSSFNKNLDLCLLTGATDIKANASSMYGLFKELYDLTQDELSNQTRLDLLQQQQQNLAKIIQTDQLLLASVQVVQSLYQEQLTLQMKLDHLDELCPQHWRDQGEASTSNPGPEVCSQGTKPSLDQTLSKDEEKILAINTGLILSRHSSLSEKMNCLQQKMNADSSNLIMLELEIMALKRLLLEMKINERDLVRALMVMGNAREYLEAVMEPQVATQEFDRSKWLTECTREEAVEKLAGMPHGTFLVRPKDQHHLPYVLSIVITSDDDKPQVQHCHVVRPSGRGFGFNAALAVFESVDQLVLRHRYVSLRFYFKDLDAPLAFPVGCKEILSRNSSSCDS